MSSKECFKCILKGIDRSCDDITLDKLHNKVILGRGPLANITDKRCSRSQVVVELNIHSQSVKIKQVGSNSSGVNGEPLTMNEERQLNDTDVMEVLHNTYKYKVEVYGLEKTTNEQSSVSEDQSNVESLDKNIVSTSVKKNGKYLGDDEVSESDEPSRKILKLEHEESGDPNMKGVWDIIDGGRLLVFTSNSIRHVSKIASFDLDGTLITTKSGKVFPVDMNDWKILFPNKIESSLKQYEEDDYKIVIFTNQHNIGKKKMSSKDFQSKAEKIIKSLKVPVQMFVATHNDKYRKPVVGMWDFLCKEKNGGVPIDVSQSFYVGDAAGRAANWAPKKKKDFACTDHLFALNLDLKFCTPEEFFLKEKSVEMHLPSFIPKEVYEKSINCYLPDINHDRKQVIIMIGSQGSGKSHFVSTYLKPLNYTIANRDTLGSWQKCVSVMKEALDKGSSVVVDNTNPEKESRRRFIEAARKHGVKCIAVHMNISKAHARHNIRFRELTDPTHVSIPDMIINSYFTKFQEPTVDEGFDQIVNVNFVPRKFSNADHEKLYWKYLLDK